MLTLITENAMAWYASLEYSAMPSHSLERYISAHVGRLGTQDCYVVLEVYFGVKPWDVGVGEQAVRDRLYTEALAWKKREIVALRIQQSL